MIAAITDVWSDILEWIITAISGVQEIFITTGAGGEASLTFLGVLSVVSVAIGLVFLVIGVIQNFLHLRS